MKKQLQAEIKSRHTLHNEIKGGETAQRHPFSVGFRGGEGKIERRAHPKGKSDDRKHD